MKMTPECDPMGRAVADYFANGKAARLRVFSPMFDEDEIPVETLFRTVDQMPAIERRALDMARGAQVIAIDVSPLCVETMRLRGVTDAREQDFFTLEGSFDTILMLMNGIGITGTLSRLPALFMQLERLLAPGGQLLCDSSDLCYLFEDEDGIIDLTGVEGYYGELEYTMQYRSVKGAPFPWLFIDPDTLREAALRHGFEVEVVATGDHYDYLARITRR